MEKSFRIIIAILVIALGYWLWTIFFPSPEKVIRKRLAALAKAASFSANEGALSKAYHAQQVPDFFTTNIEITAEVPGQGTVNFEGRDSIMQMALAARQQLQNLQVEFVGINVTLGEDKQTATVNLTAKITGSRSNDFTPQEFNFMLRKEDGKWLIYRIETVKTLSEVRAPYDTSLLALAA